MTNIKIAKYGLLNFWQIFTSKSFAVLCGAKLELGQDFAASGGTAMRFPSGHHKNLK